MDPLSLVGLGVGFLGKLFGSDPQEEYEKRKRAAIEGLKQAKTKAINRITHIISGNTASNIAQVSQGGSERAAAMGRPDAADALIQPQVSKVATAGADALGRATADINNQYDQNIANLEVAGLNAPVSPNAGDYLAELGGGVSRFGAMQSYLDAVSPQTTPTAVPTEQTGLTPMPEQVGTPTPESSGMVPAYQEPTLFQGLPSPQRKKKGNISGFYNVPDYTMAARR